MKRNTVLILALLAAACLLILMPASEPSPAASGVGACHWIPADLHNSVGWGYDTTTPFHWWTFEPSPGVYDFTLLDEFMNSRPNVTTWLSIQTVGGNIDGEPKAPDWLLGQGAVWHTGTCTNGDGLIAPWDEVYVGRLPLLLQAINDHVMSQDYKNRVGGVVIMSGGMYGEYQLWSCNMYDALYSYYGYDDTEQFGDDYYNAVRDIVRIYANAFPDMPLMLQVGTPPNDYAILNWFVREYRERAYVKWAGLDPDNVGDGKDEVRRNNNARYGTLYRFYRQNNIPAHFGFEVGHPEFYQDPIGSGTWVNERFHNVFKWALDAGAEFMCFQGVDALPALMQVPGWQEFDAAMEGAAPAPTVTPTTSINTPTLTPGATATVTASPTSIPSTPTSVPTNTPRPGPPVDHKGGVGWPGAPVALVDGIAELGASAVHHWNYSATRLALMAERDIEYLPHVWGCGTSGKSWDTIDLVSIGQFAQAHPGLRWLVFNEPDRSNQANCSPGIAADVYHDVYYALKEADPTCRVYCCGTSEQRAHKQWMGDFIQQYSEKYSSAPPMDGVHLHFYGRFEDRFDYDKVQNAIIATRNEMQELPWIITEWGVLSDVGDSPNEVALVGEFLRNMWSFLEAQPWIETHFWFSGYVDDMAANLFVGRSDSTLTLVGQVWHDMARTVPLPTATPTPAPTSTPTAMPTVTPTRVPTNTRVPTSTPTGAPTNTPTYAPTSTPTNTPTSVPTETPTSNVLRLSCEINLDTGDVRCWPIRD